MVNIFGAHMATQKPGQTYLQPRINFGQSTAPALSPTQAFNVQTAKTYDDDHWTVQAGKFTFGGVVDVADGIAALMPGGPERGQLNTGFWNGIGMPGMGRWVEENHGGVEIVSGLLGSVVVAVAAETAAVRVASSAWAASAGLSRAMKPLVAVANAQKAAADATKAAAAAGNVLRWNEAANLRLFAAGVIQGSSRAAVSEVAIAATMSQNSFVWSDDTSQNLLLAGLGIAIPGLAGGVFARGEVMRWANSDEVRLAASGAVDPAGLQRGAQTLPDVARAGKKPESVLAVNDSYTLTQLALDANLDDVAAAKSANIPVGAKRETIKTEMTALKHEYAQRIARRGIDMAENTSFSITDNKGHYTSPGKHVAEALEEDPTLALGLQSWGVADDVDDIVNARDAFKTSVMKKPGAFSQRELELLTRHKNDVPMVLVGKRWMTLDDGRLYARHAPTETVVTQGIKSVPEVTIKAAGSGKKIRIREDGRLSTDWAALPDTDLLSARDGMRAQIQTLARKKLPVTVPKDAKFIELDYAVELEARGGVVNWSSSKVKDAGEARLESLRMKAAALKGKTELTAADRIRFNLPLPTSVEKIADPTGSALMNVIQAAPAARSIDEVKAARRKIAEQLSLTTDVKFDDAMDGDIFNFGFGYEGQPLKPVVGYFKDTPAARWTKFDVREAAIEGKSIRIQQLLRTRKSKFVSTIVAGILNMPQLQLLSDVTGLMDSQIGGTRNILSSVAASALTQAHRFRNNPILLAAQQYRRSVNHAIEQQIDQELKSLSPLVQQIMSPAASQSKMLFDSYMSHAVGWDIKSVKQLPDGKVGFVLEHDSAHNLQRLTAKGQTLVKGQLLLNPRTGKPVVLDGLGNQTRIQWEAVADRMLDARNSIREARGLDPIKKRGFYVMPKSVRGKYVGFTLGPNNKVIEGKAVVANTIGEWRKQVAKIRAELEPGQRFMAQEDIARYTDIWDQAEMDFIDPTSMAGPGGVQTGTLASDFIDSTSVERMLTYVKEGYESIGNGITRTVFGEQLKIAEAHHLAAIRHGGRAKGTKDIHEVFMETMMGMPSRMNPTGAVAILSHVDEAMDAALESMYPGGKAVNRKMIQPIFDMAGYPVERLFGKGKKYPTFAELADDMGDYIPFKDVNEYAEHVLGIETPWKSRELARKVNQFGAASILRWGEMTHAVMNMAGIITNMPGLVGAKNMPLIGKVKGVGIIDTTRLMARGFKRMLREGDNRALGQKFTPDAKHMIDNGDMSQQAAEFDVAFGQLKPGNHSAFHKFMFGDKNATNWFQKKGFDGTVSFITDSSESMSRRWAHYVGLELADAHGVMGLEARHTFAREIANSAIANYDIWNRPEIYQNAFGSMYGLFLSYAQNYYQRLWSFMEVGDYNAMGRTLAIQSAMFGFGGMPGFRQLSALIGGEEDNESVMDGIYERFGPTVGAIVAQGGFNQITSLLSMGQLPAMALHTRGDVNFRHPSIDTLTTGSFQLPVGLEVMKDMGSMVIETLGALATGPGGPRQAAEIAARHMPNRVISGVIGTLGAGGNEVDQYGNVVSETQGWAETLYRIMGVRSARQQGEIEAYFMNQRALQIDAQRMDTVRKATRSVIRAGEFEKLPQIFEDYLDAGGKPWNYSNWVDGIVREAAETRGQNQLLKAMRSPEQQGLARRIELMTSGY